MGKGERERGDAPGEKGFGVRARARAHAVASMRENVASNSSRSLGSLCRVRVNSAGREYARDESDKDRKTNPYLFRVTRHAQSPATAASTLRALPPRRYERTTSDIPLQLTGTMSHRLALPTGRLCRE